jgi:YHS domain-containing protein
MRERLALLFPWLVLGIVLGGIVLDRTRTRDVAVLAADVAMPAAGMAPQQQASALVARDPVCRMDVARGSSWVARWGEREFLFCTQACREEFAGDPARWLEAPASADRPGWRSWASRWCWCCPSA